MAVRNKEMDEGRPSRLARLIDRYERLVKLEITFEGTGETCPFDIDRAVVECLFGIADLCMALRKGVPEWIRRVERARQRCGMSRFSKRVFGVMPFEASFKAIWKSVLAKAAQEKSYDPCRADDLLESTELLDYILRHIREDRATIADVTGSNPNVMFELGYAHGRGKPFFLSTQSIADLPFDLRGFNATEYKNYAGSKSRLKGKLAAFLSKLRMEERRYLRLFCQG